MRASETSIGPTKSLDERDFRERSKQAPVLAEGGVQARDQALHLRGRDTSCLARFGVLRGSPSFWAYSDRINDAYRRQAPLEGGLFDYNRLDAL